MAVRNVFFIPLMVAGLALAGCGAGARDAREENHPLMRRALACKRAGDVDGAIARFQEALEKNPRLARAHLELGLLFDQEREDYLRALYHYERYLEMRPTAEKREIVEGLARRARLSFAAAMTPTPPGAVETIAALRRENEWLRAELSKHRADGPPVETSRPPTAAAGTPETAPATLPAPAPIPPPPAVTTHVVRPGDTLSSIALQYYGDASAARRIHEANRAVVPDPNKLKVGTTLTLPRP
jgi:tetratricopeptide (TPR) repeat protein